MLKNISESLIRKLGILPVVTERFFFYCVCSQMTLKSSSNQFWKGEYLINSGGKIIIQKTPTLRF